MLEHVVDTVGSSYSESYVEWILQCWSMSWSKLVTLSRASVVTMIKSHLSTADQVNGQGNRG